MLFTYEPGLIRKHLTLMQYRKQRMEGGRTEGKGEGKEGGNGRQDALD